MSKLLGDKSGKTTKEQHFENVNELFKPDLSGIGGDNTYKSNIFKNKVNEKKYGTQKVYGKPKDESDEPTLR